MKKILLILFVSINFFVHAQVDSLFQVPGTHCSMVPPKGFDKAETFSGFQQPTTGSSIMITELPTNYMVIVNSFTADALAKAGLILINSDTIIFNEITAFTYLIKQKANEVIFNKQVFIFGNDKQAVMVNGMYPENETAVGDIILSSMKSVRYNETTAENGKEAVKFALDPTGTSMIYSGYVSGALMYSQDGKMPTQGSDNAVFTVGSSFASVTIGDTKAYTQSRLKSLPYAEETVIKTINPITINNISGYEIVAEGKDREKKPQLIYFVMLYPDNESFYIMVGMTSAKYEDYLSDFRKIAQSFTLK
ncbi:MAG TPA: hypothetical protein PLJ00_11505 [Chitinophagales bacterium]|jgi:hypothetical protein|nr:hypothetical protein [Chitinophagales bacterium]HRG28509.1 hypothetical protein [Chitinophagales bacterium]HRG86755.1 hypothetical protein [Chitinophagales bacterium]HRH52634.1 hypothetical protein [Chitinophagales bacterium]